MSEPQPDAQRGVPMVAMTPAIVAALDRLIQQARTRRRVPMLVTNENGDLEIRRCRRRKDACGSGGQVTR